MSDLSLWLNSINRTKVDVIAEADDKDSIEKDYLPYVINHLLSLHSDSVLFANELNFYSFLPKKIQYHFYLYGLRARPRFAKWVKPEITEDLKLVKKYFQYSDRKAEEALKILTPDQLKEIRETMETGGTKKKLK